MQAVQFVAVGFPLVGSIAVTLGKLNMPSYGAGCSWFQVCIPS